MLNAIKELVNSGQIQAGKMVRLETIPIPFLKDVPLIQGQWLDQRLVEMAEWGALIQTRCYQPQEDPEAHQLATVDYVGRVLNENPDQGSNYWKVSGISPLNQTVRKTWSRTGKMQ
jgi:hypothetical protein